MFKFLRVWFIKLRSRQISSSQRLCPEALRSTRCDRRRDHLPSNWSKMCKAWSRCPKLVSIQQALQASKGLTLLTIKWAWIRSTNYWLKHSRWTRKQRCQTFTSRSSCIPIWITCRPSLLGRARWCIRKQAQSEQVACSPWKRMLEGQIMTCNRRAITVMTLSSLKMCKTLRIASIRLSWRNTKPIWTKTLK